MARYTEEHQQAYDEGYAAYTPGESKLSNPYAGGDIELYDAWQAGYDYAVNEEIDKLERGNMVMIETHISNVRQAYDPDKGFRELLSGVTPKYTAIQPCPANIQWNKLPTDTREPGYYCDDRHLSEINESRIFSPDEEDPKDQQIRQLMAEIIDKNNQLLKFVAVPIGGVHDENLSIVGEHADELILPDNKEPFSLTDNEKKVTLDPLSVSQSMLYDLDAASEAARFAFERHINHVIVHGDPFLRESEEIFKRALKYAKDATGRVSFVHCNSMNAYKTGDYNTGYALIEPVEIDKSFVFDHWCSMLEM